MNVNENCKKCFHKDVCAYRNSSEDDKVCRLYLDKENVKILNNQEKENENEV